MNGRIPWMQRTFRFDFPWELFPEQLERVRGTPVRAAALVAGLPQAVLAQRVGERWSIQENIGHLADLDEELFLHRIGEYEQGVTTLKAADMSNATTNNARHNERAIADVLERFVAARRRTVQKLELLPRELFGRAALHPRLKTPMRLVDLVFFNAEHDDYHMAHITQLKRDLTAR
jgi:uncharacterized damage-inducible protein DinB